MKSVFSKSKLLLLATGIAGVMQPVLVKAQGDKFGSNNVYYNQQYNDGVYTNARYDNKTYTFNDFFENLAPYGTWIEDAQLGYVWAPDVDHDFRPYYTNGYWVPTDYGNTWISNYIWGWACFHYGRWTFDAYYGWLWIPGQNWGPAWVSWRSGDGFYGWAPLSPDYELANSDLKKHNMPKDWWVFIPQKYIYSQNHYRYYTGPLGASNSLKHSELMDNSYNTDGITYVAGPTPLQVKNAIDKPITALHVNNAGTPRPDKVFKDIVKLFRPTDLKPANLDGEKYVPSFSIKAPKAVTHEPEAVNVNGGGPLGFKRDLPGLLKKVSSINKPVKKVMAENGKEKEAERADKWEYKTEVKTVQPKVTGSSTLPRPSTAVVPPQGSQKPEPVELPKNTPTPLPPVSQHGDPIPAPSTSTGPAQPAPVQRPEPINPGSR